MLTHWEEFNSTLEMKRVHLPRVTIRPNGEFRLSRSAVDLLGGPTNVVLLYDRVNGRIGVRAADASAANSYKLGVRYREPRASKFFFAKNFLNYHNIRLHTAIAFEAVDRSAEGYLVLDMTKAVECARGRHVGV
jgi:hypothetical protein